MKILCHIAVYLMVACTMVSIVKCHKACARNSHLMTSMQYQLKQMKENEKCNSGCKAEMGVGFLSIHSVSRQNVPNDATVAFNTATYNQGGAYDHKTGIFTAPTTGLYFFTWTMTTQKGKTFFTSLVLNEKTQIAYNHADGRVTTTANVATTQSAVVPLKKGDKICLKTFSTGQFLYGDKWSTFSGFKIN